MTIAEAFTNIDLRLNKGASHDHDNIWPYHKVNAINKGLTELIRRLVRGKNITKEGDEDTTSRVDDLQVLLKRETLTVRDKGVYVESNKLPSDYLYFKRLTPFCSKGSCTGVRIVSRLKEEANADVLLPTCSFDLEETFHTLIGNKVNIYHNKDFKVDKAELTYYRRPKVYSAENLNDVLEFKEDICELIVDEAVKILASDIESLNQKSLSQERTEYNN